VLGERGITGDEGVQLEAAEVTACWQFIGDINGYVRHGALVVEGAVVVVAEAGVLVTVGVRDVVLKAKEEMSEGFSGLEVELANAKWDTGHASSA